MNTITTIITLTKAGHGSVTLKQGQYSDGQKWYVMTVNGIDTSINGSIAMNMAYKQYIANGWTVKPAKEEKKVEAPKPPKKVKKSREESLTEKYGDKEARKAYIEAKKAFHRYYMVKFSKYSVSHDHYLKAVDMATENALKAWEEAGRPAYNC